MERKIYRVNGIGDFSRVISVIDEEGTYYSKLDDVARRFLEEVIMKYVTKNGAFVLLKNRIGISCLSNNCINEHEICNEYVIERAYNMAKEYGICSKKSYFNEDEYCYHFWISSK